LTEVRIERGIAEGQLRPATDAEALARFIGAIFQGMSFQVQDGAFKAALLRLTQHSVSEIEQHRA
jgi:hypothetical protein